MKKPVFQNVGQLLALAILVVGFSVGSVVAGESQRVNALTHCSDDGERCATTCEDFPITSEDEPCWLIVSCQSDYQIPKLAFLADDYRDHCP